MDSEIRFVLNTFSFLFWGALVMWMCAGFTMLEAGSVRTKNVSVICLKNIGLYSIAGLTFYLVGYNIMFTGVEAGGWFGTLAPLHGATDAERALLEGDGSAAAAVLESGHSSMSYWLFQMVFLGSAASIVSGTLAERVKLWSFFLFIVVFTTVIYPVVGAWTWGGGWLAELGFQDFAGSTVVHSTGGWAALAGVVVVGARTGKFRDDGTVKSTPPTNIPEVTLGVFIIWLGFLGFNGGSQLALGGAADAVAVANVLANTNLAAAAGVITALVLSRPVFGHVDLLASLNGAVSGLVAITAGPDIVSHAWAIFIGAVGAAVCTLGMKLLHRLKIDDEVGGDSRPHGRRRVGHARGVHRGGGRSSRAAHRHRLHRRVRVGRLAARVAPHRPDPGRPRLGPGREARSGRRRARHRSVSGVQAVGGGLTPAPPVIREPAPRGEHGISSIFRVQDAPATGSRVGIPPRARSDAGRMTVRARRSVAAKGRTIMKRKYIADLTAGEIEEALVAGARKFNAECIRLGISRVHEVDGVAVLTHPDGSRTPIPEDDEEAERFLDRYKVSLRDVRYP